MLPVIPLVIGGAAVAAFAFAMSQKDASAKELGPAPTPGTPPEPNKTPVGALPANKVSAPAGQLPAGTTPKTGDAQVVHADDAFDQALAKAIADHNVEALEALAKRAESLGLLTVARSIREEIARLKNAAPAPTPPGPDKPAPTTNPATYIVRAGDTGSSIAKAFTGNANRWPELVTANPTTKDAKIGFKAFPGQRINLPASWPAGVPALPPTPTPALAVPAALPTPLKTYLVVSGDTGQRVSQKFTGTTSRWTELLTVNPTLKSAQYGIALYTGHKINLPASWPATPVNVLPGSEPAALPAPRPVAALPAPAPVPIAAPATPSPVPESDARAAARELTAYLTSLGGLAGRYKENQTTVKAYQVRLGASADGKYGKGSATLVIQNGLVPVAPYYWSRTTATGDKAAFLSLVRNYAAADPMRKAQWDKLIADTIKS